MEPFRMPRNHAINYIILGEEHNRASEECELNEMAQLEGEEIEDNYETTMEENLAEATSEYSVSYDTMNGKVEEDTSAVLYHEQNNVDDALDDDGISLEQRYINEKRKSILLYELNAKLEKDLQQHKAEMQPINDVAGQCDPLYNPTGITDSDNNSEPLHLMTSSIKKIQSAIENFANQSERRYSGFGDFMVRELNEMDEQTSIRLINEITSMLKKEGDGHRNTSGNVK
uniref:Uncharacterized protein n=1 Tax=Anopheles minimus TaxID=112268 RepID=A0A182W8G6_9DIPT